MVTATTRAKQKRKEQNRTGTNNHFGGFHFRGHPFRTIDSFTKLREEKGRNKINVFKTRPDKSRQVERKLHYYVAVCKERKKKKKKSIYLLCLCVT